MRVQAKNLPMGNLPYTDMNVLLKMIQKLYPQVPYLVFLPKLSEDENYITKTLEDFPIVKRKMNKFIFDDSTDEYNKFINYLDITFNNPTSETLDLFSYSGVFTYYFLKYIQYKKPKEAVFNLLGPFSMSQMLVSMKKNITILEKDYRKFIIQYITVKALWIVNKIKEISPDTRPVIILEEPLLYTFGSLKRKNLAITKDLVTPFLAKLISTLKNYGCIVGVQSFEKCDWTIPMDAKADFISFDAYTNRYCLSIISEQVNKYLASGRYINWAIVPVNSQSVIRDLNIEKLRDIFENTVNSLVEDGIEQSLMRKNITFSVCGDMQKLPLIYAEKALILANQLAKRLAAR